MKLLVIVLAGFMLMSCAPSVRHADTQDVKNHDDDTIQTAEQAVAWLRTMERYPRQLDEFDQRKSETIKLLANELSAPALRDEILGQSSHPAGWNDDQIKVLFSALKAHDEHIYHEFLTDLVLTTRTAARRWRIHFNGHIIDHFVFDYALRRYLFAVLVKDVPRPLVSELLKAEQPIRRLDHYERYLMLLSSARHEGADLSAVADFVERMALYLSPVELTRLSKDLIQDHFIDRGGEWSPFGQTMVKSLYKLPLPKKNNLAHFYGEWSDSIDVITARLCIGSLKIVWGDRPDVWLEFLNESDEIRFLHKDHVDNFAFSEFDYSVSSVGDERDPVLFRDPLQIMEGHEYFYGLPILPNEILRIPGFNLGHSWFIREPGIYQVKWHAGKIRDDDLRRNPNGHLITPAPVPEALTFHVGVPAQPPRRDVFANFIIDIMDGDFKAHHGTVDESSDASSVSCSFFRRSPDQRRRVYVSLRLFYDDNGLDKRVYTDHRNREHVYTIVYRDETGAYGLSEEAHSRLGEELHDAIMTTKKQPASQPKEE